LAVDWSGSIRIYGLASNKDSQYCFVPIIVLRQTKKVQKQSENELDFDKVAAICDQTRAIDFYPSQRVLVVTTTTQTLKLNSSLYVDIDSNGAFGQASNGVKTGKVCLP
jgi:hypothetical protein